MANKNILLIEPGYKNKYPPLGLMKIAQYHGPNGKGDNVRFIKGTDKGVLSTHWDRIYVTTLFSFEWKRIGASIDFALEAAAGFADRVFVGGIAASLMHDRFLAESRWRGVRFIKGLLDGPPATALQLDDFSGEFYSDDFETPPIEDHVPDYSILEQIDYEYPVRDAYFTYASRGCVRKCSFCGVPKLEGAMRDVQSLTGIVRGIERIYGPKKDLILMDNNVVASPRFREIMAEIRDLGFVPGAKLTRAKSTALRRVDFNQGVDARILCKDPMFLRELSSICIKPLRIAFDHLGIRKPYEQAIRYSRDAGLTELSNYMLYNFHDSPDDLFERMRLNVSLNEELDIRIFSFPMRYQPTDLPDRTHVGEKWDRYFLRSMQIVLQATHGIVSGSPTFFKRAFGNTYSEFEHILLRPHHFIFNREWYETLGGRSEFDEYNSAMSQLSPSQKGELRTLLANADSKELKELPRRTIDAKLRSILHHYVPLPREEERKIWNEVKRSRSADLTPSELVPADELVEDAGLFEEEITSATSGALDRVEAVA
ncbi:MAG: radical SAM protein [Gemmatimonadota bacterium]|nr:radical SAM protein [Gemmatimonadota bacterium]